MSESNLFEQWSLFTLEVEGSGRMEMINEADEFRVIDNLIQSPRQFVLRGLRKTTQVQFSEFKLYTTTRTSSSTWPNMCFHREFKRFIE